VRTFHTKFVTRRYMYTVGGGPGRRICDYPTGAVDELLTHLDKIERKYDLTEKLTVRERDAVVESRDDIGWADRLAMGEVIQTGLTKAVREDMGRKNLEEDAKRVPPARW